MRHAISNPEAVKSSLADSTRYKLGGSLARLAFQLPNPLLYPLLRILQPRTAPKGKLGRELAVTAETINGVPVIWLHRQRAETGVIIMAHGGAYVFGPTEDHYQGLNLLNNRLGLAAAMVCYRMPPDHPYPAALNDLSEALKGLSDAGLLQPGKWILAGDSAGGGLALATTRHLLKDSRPIPAGLLLNAPWVDVEMCNPALDVSEKGDAVLHRTWLGRAARMYANGVLLSDPDLSPINGSFSGFPPVHLNVGTRDLFLPDVQRLVQKLQQEAVPVEYIEQPGGVHMYPMLVDTPMAQSTIDAQVTWVKAHLA